jgi:hypothetical protein
MSSAKPLVFISYAHLDEPENPAPGEVRWLTFVMGFLRPGVKGRRYEVWMDRLMPGGADLDPEIEAKIRACDIFVLLVSTNSTGSDYILDKEVPIVRERQRNGEAVHLYPLLLDWSPKRGLSKSTTRTCVHATASHSRVCLRANAAEQWWKPPTRSPDSQRRSPSRKARRPR